MGNQMSVYFRSDWYFRGKGFLASFTSLPQGTFHSTEQKSITIFWLLRNQTRRLQSWALEMLFRTDRSIDVPFLWWTPRCFTKSREVFEETGGHWLINPPQSRSKVTGRPNSYNYSTFKVKRGLNSFNIVWYLMFNGGFWMLTSRNGSINPSQCASKATGWLTLTITRRKKWNVVTALSIFFRDWCLTEGSEC